MYLPNGMNIERRIAFATTREQLPYYTHYVFSERSRYFPQCSLFQIPTEWLECALIYLLVSLFLGDGFELCTARGRGALAKRAVVLIMAYCDMQRATFPRHVPACVLWGSATVKRSSAGRPLPLLPHILDQVLCCHAPGACGRHDRRVTQTLDTRRWERGQEHVGQKHLSGPVRRCTSTTTSWISLQVVYQFKIVTKNWPWRRWRARSMLCSFRIHLSRLLY